MFTFARRVRCCRFLLGAFLAMALAPAPFARSGAEDEWVRPYDPVLPGCEPRDGNGEFLLRSVFVVADGEGGPVPVRDAVITGHTEEVDPAALASRLVVETRTDEYGVANIPGPPQEAAHWLVAAPGRITQYAFGELERRIELGPGVDYRFRVLTEGEAPVGGARVEYFYGCPHSPAAWTGTTDLKGDAVIENYSPSWSGNLWIVAEGISYGPYSVPDPRCDDGDRPPTLRTDAAVTATGRVLDAKGAAVAGVVVRDTDYPRGPVTVTDAAGRFRLAGLANSSELGFYTPGSSLSPRPDFLVRGFTPDVPLKAVLRSGRPSTLGDGETMSVADVAVSLLFPHRDNEGGISLLPLPESLVPLRLVRLSDGYTITGLSRASPVPGLFTTLLPAGQYRITAGEDSDRVVAATQTVDLPRPDAAPVEFVLEQKEEFPAEEADEAPEPATTLALTLEAGDAEIEAPSVEGISGAYIDEGELGDDGVWRSETEGAGPTVFLLHCYGFQSVRIEVRLPTTPGHVDLGRVVLRPVMMRTFRLQAADGTPVPVGSLTGPDGEFLGFADDEGAPRFTIVIAPRPIRGWIRSEGFAPLRIALGPETPEVLRFPAGRLVCRVKDPEGRSLGAVAYLDARRYELPDGVLDLRGLADGPHTLLLGAAGHRGEVRRLVLAGGETRRIEVTLPAR